MAATKKKDDVFVGKTESGFEFEIDKAVSDDIEVLELLTRLDSGERSALPGAVEAVLGEKQKKALYEHCRSENGRVATSKVMSEFIAIFDAIADLKNS